MIRYDGYYRDAPAPYEDGVASHLVSGYVHEIYCFLSGNVYLRTIKKLESERVDFLQSDFRPDFPNKYEIKGDELEMFFESGTEWEFSEVFEIVSPEELKGKRRTLRFVSW
jgi:hypothetical protein